MLPILPYAPQTIFALDTAKSIARGHRHATFSGGHLLKALLQEEVELAETLEQMGVDVSYLQQWADIRIADHPKIQGGTESPEPDSAMQKGLQMADGIRLKMVANQVTPLYVLAAMARPDVVFSADQIRSLELSEQELLAGSVSQASASAASSSSDSTHTSAPAVGGLKTLEKFCVDKTEQARQGKIDPIIGREGEIRKMAEILSRRTKPNVMVVGEPGVGKTALVEGFALKIVDKELTGDLQEATVLELDVGSLVAGASYKGEVEDRLKKIMKEVKVLNRAILFIDEIHTLLDPKGSIGSGAANLLKPELARGELTVIGATTEEEYRKYIERDDAFSRRFEVLRVQEPDIPTAIRMLSALLPNYEQHHKLTMASSSLEESVRLAKRYFHGRSLPDTAVDLMDRTMAAIRLMQEGSVSILESIEEELDQLIDTHQETDPISFLSELDWFGSQMELRLSPILLAQLDHQDEVASEPPIKIAELRKALSEMKVLAKDEVGEVSPQHVSAIVASSTGIPIGNIQTEERERLQQMEQHLQARVVGQDHALEIVSNTVRLARTLKEDGRPVGSFFFLGPTGTGKTELAKSLAQFLFNDEEAMIRFDMSEFKEGHSTSALLGASPGYVGYEEGGPLINEIRKRPYSVVLFDEIEKASKEVFDVFLKVLDEGKAKDKLGKEGDFSNAIILYTSNIGADYVISEFGAGNIPDEGQMRERMAQFFRPEFLARVDHIIPFAPISEATVELIFDIHAGKLVKRLARQGISLEISPEARQLVSMSGFTPEFGARPLKGMIRRKLGTAISEMILAGKLQEGASLFVGVDNDELSWKIS